MRRVPKGSYSIGLVILLASGCATSNYQYHEPAYERKIAEGTVLRNLRLDADLEDRILGLDPERISERNVREILARGPAPRIILIHGTGIPFLFHAMGSFSAFLISMG